MYDAKDGTTPQFLFARAENKIELREGKVSFPSNTYCLGLIQRQLLAEKAR